MKKSNKKQNTIKVLSRAQTAKIRKNLEKTFFNLRIKNKSRQKYKLTNVPVKSFYEKKISQLSLPPMEYNNDNNLIFQEQDEYQKAHLNEINIQNLFTEKLWEKNNLEKNEDYTKNIAYKKLIMRAKLLKAMKTNIVLRKKEFDEYNTKYYKGSKLLSEKLKNKKRKDSDDDSISDNDNNDIKERPNFITIKQPDIFSEYEYTALFQDYYCSPLELIKKIFTYDEQKIIKLDPIFFRLNKGPFSGVQENMGFSLKEKIDEEDRILQQKIEKMKEINERFNNIKKKHKRKTEEIEKNLTQKNSTKEIKIIKPINRNNNNNKNINIKAKTQSNFFFPNNDKKDKNKKKSEVYNFFPISKNKTSKKRKKLKIDVSGIKTNKKDIDFNFNTDYNVYLEIKKTQKKNNPKIINNTKYLYKDDEKIKDKKKRLTFEEIFEMFKERKKLYLDDMSYNRKKNKYKFEKLRKQKDEENQKENQQKEILRKILADIEENYKLYQK